MKKIIVKDIESQEEIKNTFCDKCFKFWAYKHPYCLLWLFIIIILTISITISELYKK